MADAALGELAGEGALAAPGDVLRAVIGEDLLDIVTDLVVRT
jgi:hypothetical protein